MYKIKINDKEYQVPTSFADITMEDYVRCFRGLKDTDNLDGADLFYAVRENESKIVSRLLGEDDDFCMNMPVVIYNDLAESCEFIYRLRDLPHMNEIVVDGVKYEIPKPEEFSLRQWIDVDVTMQDKNNDGKFLELLCILLMQRGEDGKFIPYSGDETKELLDKVKKMKASDGLSIVYHFFLRGEISKRLTRVSSKMEALTHQFRQNTTNL